MSGRTIAVVGLVVGLATLLGALPSGQTQPKAEGQPKQDARPFTDEFREDKADFATTGRNQYFVLEPGFTLTLKGDSEEFVKTVLNETKVVDGVTTRVVEEREAKNGQLVEVSRNYFVISKRTNSVYYFGEDVDIYKDGKVTSHEGAWLSGVNGARFGLMFPGTPLVGGRFYQELAPRQAMDRCEILSISETVTTPAGTFKNCMKVEDTT